MPSAIGNFISIRFLSLIAHFVILVTILWSLETSVKSCLSPQYTATEYDDQISKLTIGLSVAIALFGLEMISFLMGVSMFVTCVMLISTFAHIIAAILLAMFVVDSWECQSYWYIFAFCSAAPALLEIITLLPWVYAHLLRR